jgi:peptide/nickel transport system substrate-binding protein
MQQSRRAPLIRRRHVAVAAGIAAACVSIAACSGSAGSGGSASTESAYELTAHTTPAKGDISAFTWALYAEPASLDYAYAFDYPPNTVLANVCESLLRWNADLSIGPGLATAYANPTPTEWVYTIRQNVRFHDGTVLKPSDVVASLKRHLNPAVGSYWAAVYQNVRSIAQTGPDQVTVTLARPDAAFNKYMAASPGTVESAATLTKDGKNYGNPTDGVNCTGPFSFESWTPGQRIVLKRFDQYWDNGLRAKAGTATFVFLQDPNTRINALQTGEVDGAFGIPANAYSRIQQSGAGKLYFGTNTTVVDEIVGNMHGPLGNVQVRKALLMAIDRQALVKVAEQGVGDVTNSLVTKNLWGGMSSSAVNSLYAGLPSYPLNLAKAKSMAAAAGVHGQKIVIATSPIASEMDIITAAVAAAAKQIGLTPVINTISPNTYTAMFSDPAARKGIDLFPTFWYVSITDPFDMLGVLQTGNFSNYGGWSNAAYDTAIRAASSATDQASEMRSLATANTIASDQLPWLPMFTIPTNVFLSNKITGLSPSINYLSYPWAATIGAKG